MYIHIDPNSKLAKAILIGALPLWSVLLWFQMDAFALAWRSTGWPLAKGTIIGSVVERHVNVHGFTESHARIDYTYVVGGKTYQNNQIAFGMGRGELTWGYADRKVSAWPKGKAADVHYNPADPRVSCLETGGPGWDDSLIFLLVSAVFLLSWKTLLDAIGKLRRWREAREKQSMAAAGLPSAE